MQDERQEKQTNGWLNHPCNVFNISLPSFFLKTTENRNGFKPQGLSDKREGNNSLSYFRIKGFPSHNLKIPISLSSHSNDYHYKCYVSFQLIS